MTVQQSVERRLRSLVRESAERIVRGDEGARTQLRARATRLLAHTMYMTEAEVDRERRAELLERLARYAKHDEFCPIAGDLVAGEEGICTCGLDEVRDELAAATLAEERTLICGCPPPPRTR